MKPRLILGLLGALGLLLIPSTAYAKGPGHATISGPGLGTPIELGSASQFSTQAQDLAITSGVWAFQDSPTYTRASEARPPGDLGSRYDVTFDLGTGSFREQLYPFAVGGPVTYAVPGQVVFEQRWNGGWHNADARLRRLLVAAGVPTPLPASIKAATVDTPRTTSTKDSGVPLSLIVGIATIVIVGTVIIGAARSARRHRRSLRKHRQRCRCDSVDHRRCTELAEAQAGYGLGSMCWSGAHGRTSKLTSRMSVSRHAVSAAT